MAESQKGPVHQAFRGRAKEEKNQNKNGPGYCDFRSSRGGGRGRAERTKDIGTGGKKRCEIGTARGVKRMRQKGNRRHRDGCQI